jgi:hypothetical protein
MRDIVLATVMALGLAVSAGPAALAANIVQNGAFDVDDASGGPVTTVTGWTIAAVNSVTDAGVDEAFPHSAPNAAYIGDGVLSQSLTTVNGATYNFSFWVGVDDTATLSDGSATFDATAGGTDLFGGTPLDTSGYGLGQYQNFTGTFTATSASTTLSFTGGTTNDGGTWYVDDVSVTASSAALPEPSVMLILASALGLLTAVRRRRA